MTTLTRPDIETGRGLDERNVFDEALREVSKPAARRPDPTGYVWALLRTGMGWIFLWAFVDKVFGFGFATEAGKGWLDGGSPTTGFLKFATKGPLAELYAGLAGSPVMDWLFMLGILAIGLPLVLGIGVRLGASIGVAMLLLMYSAAVMPEHNPVLDDHIIYALIMIGLAVANPGYRYGLGRWWGRIGLVKRYRILE